LADSATFAATRCGAGWTSAAASVAPVEAAARGPRVVPSQVAAVVAGAAAAHLA